MCVGACVWGVWGGYVWVSGGGGERLSEPSKVSSTILDLCPARIRKYNFIQKCAQSETSWNSN